MLVSPSLATDQPSTELAVDVPQSLAMQAAEQAWKETQCLIEYATAFLDAQHEQEREVVEE